MCRPIRAATRTWRRPSCADSTANSTESGAGDDVADPDVGRRRLRRSVRTRMPCGPGVRRRCAGRPGRRRRPAAGHRARSGRTNCSKAQKIPLEIAVVLQVIGLDVGDDGGRRAQQQERTVALVGLDDGQLAGAEVGVLARSRTGCRRWRRTGPGRRPARATVSSDVVVVLPCVPAIAIAAPALQGGRQRRGPAQHGHAAGPGSDELLVLRVDRRGVDERVRVVEVRRPSARSCTSAPDRAQRATRDRTRAPRSR